MLITPGELDHYHKRGYLLLEGFADESECDLLRARAEELVQEFDPADIVSVFSTHEQNRLTDDYFLTSGDKIRFFFEENAFNSDGTLKYEKEKSINKIGHALHDLDPVFDRFSRNERVKELARALGLENPYLLQSMYIFKQPNIGGEVTCHQDSTFSLYRADRHRRPLVRARRCNDREWLPVGHSRWASTWTEVAVASITRRRHGV